MPQIADEQAQRLVRAGFQIWQGSIFERTRLAAGIWARIHPARRARYWPDSPVLQDLYPSDFGTGKVDAHDKHRDCRVAPCLADHSRAVRCYSRTLSLEGITC